MKNILPSVGVSIFPCWDDKTPAIKAGFAGASLDISQFSFPSPLIGVPVPANIIVIDIDTYKGMTTDKINQVLGCELDWSASYLQTTPAGGTHHAFSVSESLRQGADLFESTIGKGFDTRCAGKGYICTGGDYHSHDAIGVVKLSSTALMPVLPPEAVAALTAQVDVQHEQQALPDGDRDAEEIRKMLRCLDADCGRDEWRNAACALKHHYHDDDNTGFILFDNWSRTGVDQYDVHEVRKLWQSIKPTAANGAPSITMATIAKAAITAGYIPSSNAAAIFGGTADEVSAPLNTIELLITRINTDGGKPENLDELTTAIRIMLCSNIQRAALTAALARVLKDHGLKITDKELKAATRQQSSQMITVPQPVNQITKFDDLVVAPIDALGTIHIQNAGILRQALFGDRLVRYGAEPWWWSGQQWEQVSKHELNSKIAHAFVGSEYGKTSNIDGTDKQLRNMVPNNGELSPSSRLIFFKNGVLDVMSPTGLLMPHMPENKNASTLSVDYVPNAAPPPEWSKFLHSIFDDEPERSTMLQEIMGWSLISDNLNHQKAVAFDGASRSGKGTILDIIAHIQGRSAIDLTMNELANYKTMSTLRFATCALDRDAKNPERSNMSVVHSTFNKMTANEPLSIPLLYNQEPWVGRINCKLLIACNGIPVMADDSGAAPQRWLVLKFTKSFLNREDLELGNRLLAELPLIAAWAVEGLKRLIANGAFTMPASSLEESQSLTESSSPIVQFAADRLIIGPEYKCHGSTLWESFKQWSSETNNRLPNRNNFLRSLERALQGDGVSHKHSLRIDNVVKAGMVGIQLAACAEGVSPIHGKLNAFQKEQQNK